MKGILSVFSLTILYHVATAEPLFDKCPDATFANLPQMKAINPNEVLGLWYTIRAGPFLMNSEKFEKIDCLVSAMWKEQQDEPNTLHLLEHARKNKSKHFSKSTILHLVPASGAEGMVENNFKHDKVIIVSDTSDALKINVQSRLVHTDGGKSESIWLSCVEKDGNATLFWGVQSRTPTVDPKLEEILVEKIERYAGIQASSLRAVGQHDCY